MFCKQTADRYKQKIFAAKIYLYNFFLSGPNEQSDKFSAKFIHGFWRYWGQCYSTTTTTVALQTHCGLENYYLTHHYQCSPTAWECQIKAPTVASACRRWALVLKMLSKCSPTACKCQINASNLAYMTWKWALVLKHDFQVLTYSMQMPDQCF